MRLTEYPLIFQHIFYTMLRGFAWGTKGIPVLVEFVWGTLPKKQVENRLQLGGRKEKGCLSASELDAAWAIQRCA